MTRHEAKAHVRLAYLGLNIARFASPSGAPQSGASRVLKPCSVGNQRGTKEHKKFSSFVSEET